MVLNLQTTVLLLLNISSIYCLQAKEIKNNFFLDISVDVPVIEVQQNAFSLEKKAEAITVKIIAEDSWGTGILINKEDNIYTVLTNAHVVRDDNILIKFKLLIS